MSFDERFLIPCGLGLIGGTLQRAHWSLATLALVALSSCGESSAPKSGVTVIPTSTSSAPAHETTPSQWKASDEKDDLPDEGSLTESEYIERGMPAADRSWGGPDLATAERVLTKLVQEGYQILPRYRGRRSGALFRRMTSVQNLEIINNKSMPIQLRFPELITFVNSSSQIAKLYFAAAAQKKIGTAELMDHMGLMLHEAVVMIQTADEFMPTISKDDPTYPVRVKGLEKMRSGQAGAVMGCLQMVSAREKGDTHEVQRLLFHMTETLPRIVPRIPKGSQQECLLALSRLAANPGMKDVQPEVQKLNELVKSAVEKQAKSELPRN